MSSNRKKERKKEGRKGLACPKKQDVECRLLRVGVTRTSSAPLAGHLGSASGR